MKKYTYVFHTIPSIRIMNDFYKHICVTLNSCLEQFT